MRNSLKAVTILAILVPIPILAQPAPKVDMAALVARTSAGAGQPALQPLVGRWRVTKSIFVLGPPGHPPSYWPI